jgi:hypothetical protein
MVPVNQPLPIQQSAVPVQFDGRRGVRGGAMSAPPYVMSFKKDNWVYFGVTGFPSSAGTYRGQMPTWRAIQYVNSQGGNNAGTANPGASAR